MNYFDNLLSKRIDGYSSSIHISKKVTVKLFLSCLAYYIILLSIFPIVSALPLVKLLFLIFHTITTFMLFARKPKSNYNKRLYECILIEISKVLSEKIYTPVFIPYKMRQVKNGIVFNKEEFEEIIILKNKE
ncbi:hypothetical protein [Anaerofustis butyriciformans]|uniref:hypothetical protein n=1 Tax=Anaerofustis butyriciformans TaxID=3108533 RepID=UPI002E2F86B3|nr:hypothetical protein [Anaerofustis sp. HA2171]